MSENVAARVVTLLASARKAHSLYPAAHPEHRAAIEGLLACAGEATAAGPFTLNLHLGRLYHDSIVLPPEMPGARSVSENFEAHRVESLTFQPGFTERDALALIETISLKPSPDVDISAELESRGVGGVLVQRLAEPDQGAVQEREEQRERDRAMHRRLVTALKQITSQAGGVTTPNLSETATVVESMLERFEHDSAAVLALATMRDASEAELFHSINTMIYAVTIGAGLGIPTEGLSSLGVCALVHDIGKVMFDQNDPAQLEPMRLMHPRFGAEILARVPEMDRTAMLAAYEHHLRPDGNGWPEVEPGYVAHPYCRMIGIADRYDRLTADPPHGGGLTPDRAIIRLLQETPDALDQTFTRMFVRQMGAFPVGCLVRLSDQSVGVVSAPGEDPLRPRVRMVYGPDGLELETKTDADLADSGLEILEVIRPEDLQETISDRL